MIGHDHKHLEKVATVRVLYADTDQMGIVNNGHYLRWFEVGRAEWIRKRNKTYRELEAEGFMLPVIEAHVRYRQPARYDDLIDIWSGPYDPTAVTVKFGYALYRQGEDRVLTEGWTRHASTDQQGRPHRFPVEVQRLLGFDKKGS
jgi:acyl-CoA thioester hydrolase